MFGFSQEQIKADVKTVVISLLAVGAFVGALVVVCTVVYAAWLI